MKNNKILFPHHLRYTRFLIMLAVFFSSQVFAHRGAIDEVDDCRIRVGYEWVHFTAYTPELTAGKEYCRVIPQLGLTNLVFDYEGKKLRQVSVEFEVTKEPEGSRVFYQEPRKIKSGTVNGLVDFRKYGTGEYLAHVTIVHGEKKLDAHIPFKVGIVESDYGALIKFGSAFALFFVVLLVLIRKAKKEKPASDEIEQE